MRRVLAWAAGGDWEAELRTMFESGVWQVRPRGLFGWRARVLEAAPPLSSSTTPSPSSPSHTISPVFYVACAAGIAAVLAYRFKTDGGRLDAAARVLGVGIDLGNMWRMRAE